MRLDPPEAAGPPRRCEARWALLAALAYVVLVVATPLDRPRWLVFEALALAFVIGLAGVPLAPLFRRWLGFLTLVGFLAVLVAQGHPLRAALGLWGVAGAILAKNALAFGAMLVLGTLIPFPKLLGALARLGTPPALIATLHFMERYVHVLAAELERMVHARRARSFRRSGRLDWLRLGSLIGMLARGWDGTLRTLDSD
jgi:cobalt/nickel transport system permease protein